jgi:release factor glutamine methyltransferase
MANSTKLLKRSKTKAVDYPLAYREKTAYFMDLKLLIKPGVFIPRPETEELTELALAYLPDNKKISVLDLGSGSGAIALKIAKEKPKSSVLGIELDTRALKIALVNQKNLKLKNVKFQKGDLFQGLRQKFDYLIANLPYLPPDARHTQPSTKHEPKNALFAARYGTALIKQTLEQLPRYIRELAFFEIDPCTVMLLKRDLKKLPQLEGNFYKDLCRKTRFLVVKVKRQ